MLSLMSGNGTNSINIFNHSQVNTTAKLVLFQPLQQTLDFCPTNTFFVQQDQLKALQSNLTHYPNSRNYNIYLNFINQQLEGFELQKQTLIDKNKRKSDINYLNTQDYREIQENIKRFSAEKIRIQNEIKDRFPLPKNLYAANIPIRAIINNLIMPDEISATLWCVSAALEVMENSYRANPDIRLFNQYVNLLERTINYLSLLKSLLEKKYRGPVLQDLESNIKMFSNEIENVKSILGSIDSNPQNKKKISKISQQSISEIVDRVFHIYSPSTLSQDEIEKCNNLKENLKLAFTNYTSCQASINQFNQDPTLRIICVTEDFMKSQKIEFAFYETITNVIFVSNSNDDYNLLAEAINHELIHANRAYIHSTSNCNKIDDKAGPIFPATKENIEIYNRALDRGDKRIQEFKILREKKLLNQRLSPNEVRLLQKYTNASKGCIPAKFTVSLSKENYQSLLKINPQKNNIPIRFANTGQIKVIRLYQNKQANTYGIELLPHDPVITVISIPKRAQEYLIQIKKKDGRVTSDYLLAEREATVLGYLTPEAIHIFYPEVEELILAEKQKCLKTD